MAKRRTHAEIIARTTEAVRADTIAEMCRVLRFHCGMTDAAEALWAAMCAPGEKRQFRQPEIVGAPSDWNIVYEAPPVTGSHREFAA